MHDNDNRVTADDELSTFVVHVVAADVARRVRVLLHYTTPPSIRTNVDPWEPFFQLFIMTEFQGRLNYIDQIRS